MNNEFLGRYDKMQNDLKCMKDKVYTATVNIIKWTEQLEDNTLTDNLKIQTLRNIKEQAEYLKGYVG